MVQIYYNNAWVNWMHGKLQVVDLLDAALFVASTARIDPSWSVSQKAPTISMVGNTLNITSTGAGGAYCDISDLYHSHSTLEIMIESISGSNLRVATASKIEDHAGGIEMRNNPTGSFTLNLSNETKYLCFSVANTTVNITKIEAV